MKKDYLNIALFVLFLFVLGLLNLADNNKVSFSELENRALKEKPVMSLATLMSGEYFREFEDYFADNFFEREHMVALSRKFTKWRGLPTEDEATIVTHHGANVYQQQTKDDDLDKDLQVTGRVLVVQDRGMEIHTYDPEAGALYAEIINEFAARVKPVRVYSMLVPTQIEFYNGGKYRKLSSVQLETIRQVNNYFIRGLVQPVNVYDNLRVHCEEYIYFRTDHHWTALGAYYAYTAFMETQGLEPVPLGDYQTGQADGFLGSTYNTTLSDKLKENPDQVVYYKPLLPYEYQVFYEGSQPVEQKLLELRYAEQANKYGIFLGGDNPWARISTGNMNNKKILVIKDSYGNAFVSFLLPHYQEIYVLDPRMFKGNVYALIQKNGISEVLFLNYVLITDNKGFPELLGKILGYEFDRK